MARIDHWHIPSITTKTYTHDFTLAITTEFSATTPYSLYKIMGGTTYIVYYILTKHTILRPSPIRYHQEWIPCLSTQSSQWNCSTTPSRPHKPLYTQIYLGQWGQPPHVQLQRFFHKHTTIQRTTGICHSEGWIHNVWYSGYWLNWIHRSE